MASIVNIRSSNDLKATSHSLIAAIFVTSGYNHEPLVRAGVGEYSRTIQHISECKHFMASQNLRTTEKVLLSCGAGIQL